MMGLVYKDLLVQRKTLLYYLTFLAVYCVLVVAGAFDSTILSVFLVVVGTLVPMTTLSYDEQARWNAFAAALPRGRERMVGGKYVLVLLVCGAGCVVTLVLTGALALLDRSVPPLSETVAAALACAAAGVFINCVALPLIFKLGEERSRAVYLSLIVLLFGGLMLATQVLTDGGFQLPQPPDWAAGLLPLLATAGLAAVFGASWAISLRICRGKEY